jgi:ribosomal protein S18 acetylase RimI-like enzyme
VLSGPPVGLVVRELGPDDWELFRRLRLAALAEAPAAFGSRYIEWVDAEPERWRARLTDVPLNLALLLDGAPVGLVSGTAPWDRAVELISLWVTPAARGRGVSDEAVRNVADWARSRGASRLVLSVKVANTTARRLYERLGFELVGPAADDPSELVLALELSRA